MWYNGCYSEKVLQDVVSHCWREPEEHKSGASSEINNVNCGSASAVCRHCSESHLILLFWIYLHCLTTWLQHNDYLNIVKKKQKKKNITQALMNTRKSKLNDLWKVWERRQSTHRIFTLSRSDTVLEATLFVCVVSLTRCCGGVYKLLLGWDVVQTGAHTWAKETVEKRS